MNNDGINKKIKEKKKEEMNASGEIQPNMKKNCSNNECHAPPKKQLESGD